MLHGIKPTYNIIVGLSDFFNKTGNFNDDMTANDMDDITPTNIGMIPRRLISIIEIDLFDIY